MFHSNIMSLQLRGRVNMFWCAMARSCLAWMHSVSIPCGLQYSYHMGPSKRENKRKQWSRWMGEIPSTTIPRYTVYIYPDPIHQQWSNFTKAFFQGTSHTSKKTTSYSQWKCNRSLAGSVPGWGWEMWYTFRLETQNQARTSLILGSFRPNTCAYLDTLHWK